MQPAIPVGTLLQNRYRIVQLLGQGGFGRTYLAEDQGRFSERCALKEFVPVQGEDRFSDKATQLFQREAAILYQITHPQIPQFRATFEQDQRLFLVQDYVEGTTYRDLLNQRRAQGSAFSETEVRQLIQQMLPVLAHIHAKGIIHRDISPDNLILRRSDQMPVLIDFGVVKEVVTRLQHDGTEMATTVGKVGYAPSEQMQTGRAYPNSDLYSLAVTAVVLLTGKEPQALFDDVNLAWTWQQHTQVSPELAQVLNRALSYRPGDRYQSVSQMAQALSGQAAVAPSAAPGAPAPPKPPTAAAPPLSEMRTVAVGRPAPSTRPQPTRTAAQPPVPEARSGLLENPWAVTGIGAVSAIVAGMGGWAVVNYLSEPATPTPTITPMPTATPTPTPTDDPSPPQPQPTEYNQALTLGPGDSQTVEGTLRGGDTINYSVSAEAGQILAATLRGEGVLLSVLDPSGELVADDASRRFRWRGPLESDGDYIIQLSPVQGLSRSDYALDVELLAAPEPDEPDQPSQPDEPDEPSEPDEPDQPSNVQPEILQQRVQFPAGETGVTVANSVGPGRVRRYIVNARQGQILSVQLQQASGPVTFDVRLPDGELMADASGVLFWQSYLPLGGDYAIDVKAPSSADFGLEIQVTGQSE
ncbi:MAG: serine/threonine protein kinase [Leptolyngbya sp. SIO4C1]|nr:serine/threonine protein kinase [Leptolyngbya sp. SIO4C1]